ncbi:GyrI-like domain-containing protein [Pararhizobium sp.]|uniref:GyrI-like domain-containing protein n=1 Tax=Pararhizobium sp. TaxID=1977563 RepID=UPI00271C891B|nr:GyrI-like domain-containing protein [Pararhizobium sp.]MDO9417077.1 GyrI-like domain-containing protein [Pararhizobium sp.]
MTIDTFSKLAEPTIEKLASMRLTGLKAFHADPGSIPAQWGQFAPHIPVLQPKNCVTYGICWMKSSGGEDYMCAGEAANTADLLPDFTVETLPPMTCAVFFHAGHVSAIHETVDAIFTHWMPASGRKPLPDGPTLIERYDRRLNPETGTGGFDILIPLEE